MSREIDFNNPESWSDADRAYLADRVESVPVEHRHLVMPEQPTMAPMATAEDPRMVRLTDFVRRNYPDRAGEDPITVVMDLLGDSGTGADDADETDDYDEWTVADLTKEANNRDGLTAPTGADARRKQPWIDALRAWDAEHPS
jgi:hypothetical protein